MFINNLFTHDELVQLKTDDEQKKRIVTAIVIRKNGAIEYQLACGVESSGHTEGEIEKYNEQEVRKPGF